MQRILISILFLFAVTAASPALALTCPSGFLEVSNASGALGCIQEDIERTSRGDALQRNWPDAVRACFDDYGGRLPTPGEMTIAEATVSLASASASVWTDNLFFDAGEYAVTVRILGPGSIDYGFNSLTTNGFQRCWIPAEAEILSVVPTVRGWGLGGLVLALAIAGVLAIGSLRGDERAPSAVV